MFIKTWLLQFRVALFTVRALAYNKANARAVVFDSAFRPVFWVVDRFVNLLGPVFVLLVIVLITAVVMIYYTTILPSILEKHIVRIILHLLVAHWLLLNISFHYLKSVFTSPGYPPEGDKLPGKPENYLICRKCSQAKPPRTHHCSICKRCILKMDHHCPWINNCVGHFNHRYFILFCIYMTLGSLYVAVSAWDLFLEHFFSPKGKDLSNSKSNVNYHQSKAEIMREKIANVVVMGGYKNLLEFEHNSSVFVFMLCSAVTLALGLLTLWHAKLIADGQTSIELYINRANQRAFRKKGLVYKNPYNYGAWDNWRLMLGLVNNRSWMSVLLPSSHHPYGNGLSWPPPPPKTPKNKILPL
ncbi:palmitoyltransferase ZDHHC16 [Nematostella vectensis]|uniref:palmitoyltransferase ZDHHC16 n=1 Tax=Nematostella vectensis TaxID=45351 RepID=UPI0020775182|nr:palmitoyltransferase ZDHHC16 [Nematostella vectensis]